VAALAENKEDHTQGPQGIRLTTDGLPGSFAAFALASHHADGNRYFSSVQFSDPKMLNSANTVFTGVPVGDTSLLTPDRYVPQLTLTNFSARDVHVRTIFARTSDRTSVQQVGMMTVPGNSVRELVLSNLNGVTRPCRIPSWSVPMAHPASCWRNSSRIVRRTTMR
jgi:hypothetical protein